MSASRYVLPRLPSHDQFDRRRRHAIGYGQLGVPPLAAGVRRSDGAHRGLIQLAKWFAAPATARSLPRRTRGACRHRAGHVSPSRTRDNLENVAWREPESLANPTVAVTAIPVERPNLRDLPLGNAATRNGLAARLPVAPLTHHVGRVLVRRTNLEVRWPDALAVVASVHDVKIAGYWSEVHLVTETMRAGATPGGPRDPEDSITFLADGAGPFPAAVRPDHAAPKTHLGRDVSTGVTAVASRLISARGVIEPNAALRAGGRDSHGRNLGGKVTHRKRAHPISRACDVTNA